MKYIIENFIHYKLRSFTNNFFGLIQTIWGGAGENIKRNVSLINDQLTNSKIQLPIIYSLKSLIYNSSELIRTMWGKAFTSKINT